MKKVLEGNLLSVNSSLTSPEGIEIVYKVTIKSNHPNTRIGYYGCTISYVARPTANCQLASIRSIKNLYTLNQEEINDLVDLMRKSGAKLEWLIDIHLDLRRGLVDKFKKAGCRTLMSKKYLNNTGSQMAIVILDLTKRSKNGKALR